MRIFPSLAQLERFLDLLEVHGVTVRAVYLVGSTFRVEFDP